VSTISRKRVRGAEDLARNLGAHDLVGTNIYRRCVRESEVEVAGEVGTPFWSPLSAKLSLKMRHTWQHREAQYVDGVAASSGLSRDELEQACLGDEVAADVFYSGGRRALGVADDEYRSALARLVAAAFFDEAKIQEVVLLTSQLIQLEPAHLRLLRRMFHSDRGSALPRWPAPASYLGELIDVGPETATGILERLAGFGLVKSYKKALRSPESVPLSSDGEERKQKAAHDFHRDTRHWDGTPWGRQAVLHCASEVGAS
jgi:hypothetical protein